ncbi:oxaloacetate decarboxylase subunit alpha [Clostridium estertheticum]|uniref:Oxaloacetate decarboxylase subunit alpha n=1 Tax=Clostridium estertheticum TaxID=238834 RepID=A0AA47EJN1_9CLOT|nr:oxaloacetate decarboxylase subunit alpha [Clostridium estertheticum]MBU3153806.1 oxaloacetate decarboxylase subunit alpha [Clostridium estertheticum]MBU3198557.1 oxaloacetate decarboxylase subunit alpha [Clostridium estertheticum]WAG61411.1 oxaloacetate decarboxylase subunit alpha [Clostridium estertheticum]WAG64536.1 oxaloacetate decarboxylase subunit alpha [Clostridium estertheticum]
MNPIRITETVIRDGQQSLIATRLKTEEILPILEKMDKVGYYSMEVWGGATFDSCLRFLNEDPWERLREIRKIVKNTKLQMILRGQNLLGYKHYADDVVEAFIKKSIENGIDIIRVFDALNDTRNMETSIRVIKEGGAHCQCAICYTTSPVHTLDYYVELSIKLEKLGAHSICINDMAGILTPYSAFELVKKLKLAVKIPLCLHAHCTSGIASMTYLKAVEAGVDIIDTAISPFSEGASQPPTESMVLTLKESPRDPKLDINLLGEIADYFRPIKEKYRENGILNTKVMNVEPRIITYQVPGGMLSNLLLELKEQGVESRYKEVLTEIPRVRKDLGYPPLITPLIQMVGTQAIFNILSGVRYKIIPKELKDYVKGLYGSPSTPIKDEIKTKIIGNMKIITQRPADLLEPEMDKYKNEIGDLATTYEDVISYALFPRSSKKFFEDRLSDNINSGTCDTYKEIITNCKIQEINAIDEEERIVVALVASAMAARDNPNSEFRISKIKRIK